MIEAIIQWFATLFASFQWPFTWPIAGITIIASIRKIIALGPLGWIWAGFLILAFELITPPYVIGSLDGLIAAILAPLIVTLGVSYIMAFCIALGIIYVISASFIIFSLFII